MAILAAFAQKRFMCIVRLMAIDTLSRRLTVQGIFDMAAFALHIGVFAKQFEIGETVIECSLIKFHYRCVAAFVVSMTAGACHAARRRIPAVKACRAVKVCTNVFMAHDTQFLLGATIKFLVAGAALRLDLRMAFDDFTGHNQRLQRAGSCVACCHQ